MRKEIICPVKNKKVLVTKNVINATTYEDKGNA